MPGSGKIGWSYVDLQNQPGCVKVTYEESEDFYAKTRDEYPMKESPGVSQKYTFKTLIFKKDTTDDDEEFRDDDDNDGGGDDGDDEDDDDGGDSKEDKRLRKSCNMESSGNFVIDGQKYNEKSRYLKVD